MGVLERTLMEIYPQDSASREAAEERLNNLAMPHWALGDVMDLAAQLAGIQATTKPTTLRKAIVTMAGDHGVVAEGVSKYPAEVTVQMIHNFIAGGAGINAFARQVGAEVLFVDMGVNADLNDLVKGKKILNKKVGLGTDNIAKGPAMSKAMAMRSIESGIEIAQELSENYDIIGTGEMGIGNTTPSAAIASICTGKSVDLVTGRGTGLDDEQLKKKIAVVQRAIDINNPNERDGIDILAKVGGFEIGGIAGLVLGCAATRTPVVIDGFIATAGAMIAAKIEPFVRDYLIFAHRSVEPGHKYMQEALGCEKPLLDLNFRLGEGTGGALAMNIVDAACAVLSEIATFEEAAVATADK